MVEKTTPGRRPRRQTSQLGSGLRSCDSQSTKLLATSYGHVGREFKLRPFSAGSILTLRNRIEPLASTTSVERTPPKMQSTKLAPSITAPGETGFYHWLLPQRTQRKTSENKPSPRRGR